MDTPVKERICPVWAEPCECPPGECLSVAGPLGLSPILLPEAEESSNVISPHHYDRWKIEPITFIMENELPFAVGNVIKYVMRAPYKNGVEDLQKAKRYLEFLINQAEGLAPVPDD